MDALRRIIDSSFRHGIYTFFATRSLKSAPRIVVSEIDGEVAGFAEPRSVSIGGRKIGNILWIAIHPDFRRRGVASALVAECARILSEQEACMIFVSVESDNLPAFALFEKEGFRRISSKELRREFGLRVISFYSKLLIAPHEVVLVRSCNDHDAFSI
jgi:ribosomal protein S18 acetylase RimI-like enzyme